MESVVDSKRDIFKKLSAFTSLKEIELEPNNIFDSISTINNNKDIVPFLLDLSTSLVGSDGLENKFGLVFTEFIDKYNVKSKEILSEQFLNSNTNTQLPSDFVNNGINIPISSLDDSNNLKTSKVDPVGELIFDDNKDNLLTNLKNSIISPSSSIQFKNILSIVYNEQNQEINIKPIGNLTIGAFLGSFINNFSGINKKKTVADILDKIYGLKSKLQNKTVKEIYDENLIDLLIDKIINEDNIELTPEESDNLNNLAEEIFKGFNEIDLGCGFITNSLSIEELTKISNTINDSTDPNEVSNSIVNLFIDSLDQNSNDSNKTALKDSFIKKIINQIKSELLKDLLFSPEKKLLFILSSSFQGDNNLNKDKIDFIKDNYNIADCLVKNLYSDLVKFIFDLVKTEILEVTKPALNKIIKEKINNYILLLRSLINI